MRPDTHFGAEIAGIKDGVVRLHNGSQRVIVKTSSLNFGGLAPEQQLRTVQAFKELLHAQSGPFQLYIRIRRVLGGDADEPEEKEYPRRSDYLGALTRSFINAHLAETPVYQRDFFVVLSPADGPGSFLRSWNFRFDRSSDRPTRVAIDSGQSLHKRAVALIEQLRQVGLNAEILGDGALTGLFNDLYNGGRTEGAQSGFVHRPNGVQLGERHYASFAVDRYPGEEVEAGWLLPLLNFTGELHVGLHIPSPGDR